jgi:hypothetical protein
MVAEGDGAGAEWHQRAILAYHHRRAHTMHTQTRKMASHSAMSGDLQNGNVMPQPTSQA